MNTKKINKLWVLLPVLLAFETACRKKKTQANSAYDIKINTKVTGFLGAGDIREGFGVKVISNRKVEEEVNLELTIDGVPLTKKGCFYKGKFTEEKKYVIEFEIKTCYELNSRGGKNITNEKDFFKKDVIVKINSSSKSGEAKVKHTQYEIRNESDFAGIELDDKGDYEQVNDITLYEGFTPFEFNGSYNGKYNDEEQKKIRGLNIAGSYESGNTGLFTKLLTNAVVLNLYIESPKLRGDKTTNNIGVVAGENLGIIMNVSINNADVRNGNNVGIVCGSNDGKIYFNSVKNAAIAGDNKVGGIVGSNNKGELKLSYVNDLTIYEANNKYGALVGDNVNSRAAANSIERNYAEKIINKGGNGNMLLSGSGSIAINNQLVIGDKNNASNLNPSPNLLSSVIPKEIKDLLDSDLYKTGKFFKSDNTLFFE